MDHQKYNLANSYFIPAYFKNHPYKNDVIGVQV